MMKPSRQNNILYFSPSSSSPGFLGVASATINVSRMIVSFIYCFYLIFDASCSFIPFFSILFSGDTSS